MRDGYIKSRLAAVTMPPCVLAAFTGTNNQVTLATGPTAPLAGVVDTMGAVAGSLCDVQMTEVADLVAGGPIAAGDPITSDANGNGVKAAKLAGQTVYCIGFAQAAHVVGDIMAVLIAPFLIVG